LHWKITLVAFGAVVGSPLFLLFMDSANAEEAEKKMLHSSDMSDVSKVFYLEVLDATFSMTSIGAFAFTMSVPLILIGNGIGHLLYGTT